MITPTVQTARRGADTPRQKDWSWVEASVWTERMRAALENGVKGGKWYSLMDKVYRRGTLEAAWQRVKANRGAAGVDRMSIERFEAHAERYLRELERQLQSGHYRPQAVRRVYIPKADGKQRPLGIPAVKDRIVQTALKLVVEPIFDWEFLASSHGFRPGHGCKEALREVDEGLQAGDTWVVDADIKSYFDSIPHGRLMEQIEKRIADRQVLTLIDAFLSQSILDGMERWTPTQGSPQGAVISPLLANIYLHELDCTLSRAGYRWVRYADDFVVLCATQAEAEQALRCIQTWMTEHALTLHPEKTHVGDCRQPGQGFEFLGYRFEGGRRWVRNKSLKALKDTLRTKTRRTRGDSMRCIIAELNPTLRGWFAYFKHAHHWTYGPIDGFVRRRLRAIRRKQTHRPGFGSNHEDHRRWPNAYFAAHGLFTLREAHVLASQSR